jgi:putative toxin-antitoxin system antitoxin component (TIGR02293 family)
MHSPASKPIRELLDIASHGSIKIYDGTTVVELTKLGFSMDELYRLVAPRRTLARRIANGEPLSVSENDGALRVVRITKLAEQIFGAREKAQRWLRKPNRGLGGIVPVDLLQSESGAVLVEQALQQIDHGIYV